MNLLINYSGHLETITGKLTIEKYKTTKTDKTSRKNFFTNCNSNYLQKSCDTNNFHSIKNYQLTEKSTKTVDRENRGKGEMKENINQNSPQDSTYQ